MLLLPFPIAIQAQYNYSINPDLTISLTEYTGSDLSVSVPSEINGLPVTVLSQTFYGSEVTSVVVPDSVMVINGAFSACYGLTNVTLGSSVTQVGDYSFADCTTLPNVTIPDSVTNMGYGVFSGCIGLTNVNIGKSVSRIGSPSFSRCGNLLAINVSTNNRNYSSLSGVLFGGNQRTVFQYPFGKAGAYVVPDGVSSISDSAFENCNHLTAITVPPSVSDIGVYAFYGCTNLASANLMNGIINIGYQAFAGCSLTNLAIPDSVKAIGDSAFGGCRSLTNVIVGNGLTEIQGQAFAACTALTRVVIGNSVVSIDSGAFWYCSSLSSMTLGNSLISIGSQAFDMCSSLASLSIPNSVKIIGDGAFEGCTSLTNVLMGSGITNIGALAFSGPNLNTVYFEGDAPTDQGSGLSANGLSIIYYLPGTTGWDTPFDGRPTLPIEFQIQTGDASFGVRTNQFGFNITGSYGLTLVVEFATNLVNPIWSPLQTNMLPTLPLYFSDPEWTNHPSRFYRLRWP